MENIVLKPNKTSFFVMKMFFIFLLTFVLFILPVIFIQIFSKFWLLKEIFNQDFLEIFSIWKYISISLFFIIFWIYYIWISICYKKEQYIFSKNKIVYHYWNIFSDNSVDLSIDKITEVTMIFPFVENLIFKTWHISIQTAWSSTSRTIFSNLKNPLEVFENIQEFMRQNGFHLKKDKLVQEAKPHSLWVLFEVWWKFSWVFIFLFYVFLSWFLKNDKNIDLEKISSEINFLYLGIALWIIIVLAFVPIILNYLDLKRRKYDIYTDSIFYTNWFLTKVYSFLPMEKVSDVDNNQWFFSKFFGLHDIIVSSEWSNNKVVFLNMVDWDILIKNIKYLKNSITLTEKEVEEKTEKTEEIVWFVDKTDFSMDYDREFSKIYTIDIVRNLFSFVFYWIFISIFLFSFLDDSKFILPVILLSIIAWLIKSIIEAKYTQFILDKNTIEYKYEFLTNRHTTFTIDKVTWVSLSESILDKFFKTCTVSFFSIWANLPIIFKNVKKTKNFENEILNKIWIRKDENFENLKIDFSLKNFILKNIFWLIFLIFILFIFIWLNFYKITEKIDYKIISQNIDNNLTIIFSIIIFVLFLIPFLKFFYWKIAYSSKFYRQKIYKNFYESEKWIIFQEKWYALFKNIKSTLSIKYPFTNVWELLMEVAWDIVLEWEKWQKFSLWWMKIEGKYFKNIYDLQSKIDNILNKKDVNKEILEGSRQSIWNTIFYQFLIFVWLLIWFVFVNFWNISINDFEVKDLKIILWILLFLLIFSIWISILYIKSKFYKIETDRVSLFYGIFYKSRKNILIEKINFVEKNQGFLWKIFWNWIVKIYTVWSWWVDMTLSDSSDYNELYSKLKKD